ncbi:MAG: 16S rRNA (cytosine(1402)-N(4))-methyltransferase RsmH [Verrucomicrobiales bacterium]|nr:16S rRNA (cytosine(1402)-N(4))-methyltransferase RsmH [Verrucomicrobiales bacterium]
MSDDLPANPPVPESAEAPRHRRRPRYRGKNPRKFHEKYKELNPDRYSADVAKVIASGKTPVGTHRPIMVREILEVLAPKPGDIAVDCTLGFGGHSQEILKRILPGGRLFGLDVDPIEQPRTEARLRANGLGPDVFQVRHMNFAGLAKLIAHENLTGGVDLILADLGVSSMQIDNPDRGFTYKTDGPLDLRLNPQRSPSAADLVSKLQAAKLATLFRENSDEPRADELAAAIVAARQRQPITRTAQLADVIRELFSSARSASSKELVDDTIRRVFQALRIAANDEFGALNNLLRVLPSCLKPGGRVAFLTFHSGEDRRVKHAFQAGLDTGTYSSISQGILRPSADERRDNPRSSSAKLRWAVT